MFKASCLGEAPDFSHGPEWLQIPAFPLKPTFLINVILKQNEERSSVKPANISIDVYPPPVTPVRGDIAEVDGQAEELSAPPPERPHPGDCRTLCVSITISPAST